MCRLQNKGNRFRTKCTFELVRCFVKHSTVHGGEEWKQLSSFNEGVILAMLCGQILLSNYIAFDNNGRNTFGVRDTYFKSSQWDTFKKIYLFVFFIIIHSLDKMLGFAVTFPSCVSYICIRLFSASPSPILHWRASSSQNSFLSTLLQKKNHAMFVFLSLSYFTSHDDLQFPPFPCK